jgi:addiction module RelB/DinJ family antitoxin
MKTTTSIKLDKKVKDEASKLAGELGLSLSSVVNATLKQFVNERRVVLSVSPSFNKKTEEAFLKLREDVKNEKNLSEVYTNMSDLKKALSK